MKILATGDWQVSLGNLDRCEVVLSQVLSILRKAPTHFVFLGDIKDAFNPVDQRVTNFIIDAFRSIRAEAKSFSFVRGNHDNINTSDDSPSCTPIVNLITGYLSNSKLQWAIADARWTHIHLEDKVRLYLVPFFRDPLRQKNAFKDAWNYRTKMPAATGMKHILCFHNEVLGCVISPTRKGSAYSLAEIGAVDYDLCIGGHIHTPQFIKPNVYFVGSPFPMDWSEVNIERRLLLIEI